MGQAFFKDEISIKLDMDDKKILFIIPDEKKVYENVSVKVGSFHLPSLAFAILGAAAKESGYIPEVLDLTLYDNFEKILEGKLSPNPAYVCLTGTTAIYFHVLEIARFIRKKQPGARILIGGPHASSTVEDTLNNNCFDYLFIGEAEISFRQFLNGINPEDIEGLAFKKNDGSLHIRPSTGFLKDLDKFPFPEYSLYDLSNYYLPNMHARQNPVLWIETSRGCPFDCMICNKVVHGQTFRPKSSVRVLNEIEFYYKMGVREFLIADDGFTSNMKRAEEICDGLISRNLSVTWACINGIRVDRVTPGLLVKMRKAGCYRLSFGMESGNQSVLDNLGKKITLSQIESAVKMAKKAGLEVFGYFMFGFLDDTEDTMQDTVRFARSLPLDFAKASLIMPFPGSPLHNKYRELGLLKPPGDYREYNVYTSPKEVYRHPSLEWEIIEKFQKKFYRNFYLNPQYILRRFIHSVRNKTLFATIKAAFSVDWF
ncbi:MAG: radical SAM protein [Nitrospirae bacterium]|nr:radical SAM protein [Nitrospirota bacterium]